MVHLVQSASLRQNSLKIFHTVFETLPVGAKLLPILTPDYCHPPQSNFTEYKQDMVAVFHAPVNGQRVNQQALYFLGLSELTHVESPMHDWAAGAAKPDDPASSLNIVSHQTALRNIMFHYREWST